MIKMERKKIRRYLLNYTIVMGILIILMGLVTMAKMSGYDTRAQTEELIDEKCSNNLSVPEFASQWRLKGSSLTRNGNMSCILIIKECKTDEGGCFEGMVIGDKPQNNRGVSNVTA